MQIILGRKQNDPGDEKWHYALNHIEELVSRQECDDATGKMLERISIATAGKKAAYAWSGGKDSLVLADLCRQLNIRTSALFLTKLEFPVFEKWLLENKPEGCEVMQLPFDLDWLQAHPDMLFPVGPTRQVWHKILQRDSMVAFFQQRKLDILMIGHRTKDGNNCGKEGYVRRKDGVVLFAPLYDWPHEMILAYLHYHHISLPPIYEWENGFLNGTQPWATYKCSDETDGWRKVYRLDPSIVYAAAEKLNSARNFLRKEVQA